MDSKRGQVLKYLRHIPQDTTLVDVQYGKTEGNTQHPVFGIAASDEDLDTIRTTLKRKESNSKTSARTTTCASA